MNSNQISEQPWFYTATTVIPKNRKDILCIKTGFKELDSKIIGWNKEETSLFSGLNGSGKSSVLSQISLQVVDMGYKVALFSGELSENRVLDWIQLQAAGNQNTVATQYENYFYVKDEIKTKINIWLDQKLFIYNNNYGNNADEILRAVELCIEKKKVDIVILDNLMSLDLGGVSANDKNERQSLFIKRIKKFAKDNNIHICIVAHPRKAIGFLRKDDIAGTADLTNMVDNVFIVHRVNNDFKRLSHQMFGWREDNPIYKFSNVIEVCKNRDLGVQDLFVGLHYEIESKRFKNSIDEHRAYGWETNITIDLDEVIETPFDL